MTQLYNQITLTDASNCIFQVNINSIYEIKAYDMSPYYYTQITIGTYNGNYLHRYCKETKEEIEKLIAYVKFKEEFEEKLNE